MVTIKDLERECAKNNLTEFLKTCSLEEIKGASCVIFADDIVGIRVNILSAILTELEYRAEKENVPSKSPRK